MSREKVQFYSIIQNYFWTLLKTVGQWLDFYGNLGYNNYEVIKMRNFTTGDRLKEIMRTQNLRQVDILNKTLPLQESLNIYMSKSHLSNYVNDRSSPDNDKRRLLALALDVSEPWLMGYEVESEEAESEDADNNEKKLVQTYRKLTQPRKDKVHDFIYELLTEQAIAFNATSTGKKARPVAITPANASERVLIFEKKNGTIIYPNAIGAAAGVGTSHYADILLDDMMIPSEEAYECPFILPMYVRGDSMEPKYYDGDVIWVDTQDKSISIHQIGVFDTDDGRVVKKMGIDTLMSINPHYDDIPLHENMDFSTYGKVIDVIRREQLKIWKNAKWV